MTAASSPAPDALRAQQAALAALITAPAVGDAQPLLRPLAGAAPRLAVYRHAFRARLREALRSNYPVLHRVLGDDDFATLAQAYLDAHPSRQPSIRWFGHALADWLAATPDAVPHPALADLARMEWALGLAFDSADATPLAGDALAALPAADWPDQRWAGHPSVARVALAWAVEPLWRALTADEHAETDPPEALAHRLLVWRQGLETHWRAIAADEDAALGDALAGRPFALLCARVAERLADEGSPGAAADPGAEAAARVAGWLAGWVQAGLLCAAPPAQVS